MSKTSNVVSIKQNHGRIDETGLFPLVQNMEEPLTRATRFATALAMIAETLDEPDGTTVQQLAWSIMDEIKKVEQQRSFLIRLTHPKRDERGFGKR